MISVRKYRPVLIAAALSLITLVSWAAPEYQSVTILHTNDTHGHLIPFSFPSIRSGIEPYAMMPTNKNIGGIARRAYLAHKIVTDTKNGTLFLDAGDALDGTPFSVEFMGEADFSAMTAAGYDAMTLGNHEFSASYEEFRRNIQLAPMMISANVSDIQTGKLVFPAYHVFTIHGVKVGVFGLTIPTPNYPAAKGHYSFIDPVEAAKKIVPEVRSKSDIVVALTHIGIESDRELAKQVPDIDVIVGGHSHTMLSRPEFVKNPNSKNSLGGAIIVQDYCYGAEMGELDLKVKRDGGPYSIDTYSGKLIPIVPDVHEDKKTADVVAKYYDRISKKYDEVLGTATRDFFNDEKGFNPALHLVCDAMREQTGADIAVYNRTGVRSDILSGPIRMWDVATVLPFKNKLVEFKISGQDIKRFIERERPGISGATYKMSGRTLTELIINDKQADDSAVYTLTTSDYLLNNMFQQVKDYKVLSDDYRTALTSYIKAHKTVSPVMDGREKVE